jgi:hypothetical protein
MCCLGNAVDLAFVHGHLAPERRHLLPRLPDRFIVVDNPVAVLVLANPFVERIKEPVTDLVADDMEPGFTNIRRRLTGNRHHQARLRPAAGQLDASPLLQLQLRVRLGEIQQTPRMGFLGSVRVIEPRDRHLDLLRIGPERTLRAGEAREKGDQHPTADTQRPTSKEGIST